MKKTDRRTIIVGIFLFVGLVLLIAGILAIGKLNKSFTKKINVSAVFNDVSGLQQGNNIWYSGVKIGIVKDLNLYGNSQVEVMMSIDEKSQPYIHKDAKAKISSDGLIGNKIIIIYDGTPTAPVIEEGDKLIVERAVSTDDMMNTLQENNVNILAFTENLKDITNKIMKGQGSLGKLMTDEALFENLSAVTVSLKSAAQNADLLTATLANYSAELTKEGSLANNLITDTAIFSGLRSAVSELNEIAVTANQLVTDLKKTASDTTTTVGVLFHDESTAASLQETITNLETSSVKLDENLEALQHTFLLRGYFKKKDKEEKQQEQPKN